MVAKSGKAFFGKRTFFVSEITGKRTFLRYCFIGKRSFLVLIFIGKRTFMPKKHYICTD